MRATATANRFRRWHGRLRWLWRLRLLGGSASLAAAQNPHFVSSYGGSSAAEDPTIRREILVENHRV